MDCDTQLLKQIIYYSLFDKEHFITGLQVLTNGLLETFGPLY